VAGARYRADHREEIRKRAARYWQTAPELILCAVRWYLRYSLSLRDVEELLAERGLEVDHTTIWRWVQRYGPELEQRLRSTCAAAPETAFASVPWARNPVSLEL